MKLQPNGIFTNAADFGFLPEASGLENRAALQSALDMGGTVVIGLPGTYKLAGTVYIGSNTTLSCGAGVFLQKTDEQGPFCHVLLNRGALTKTWDEHITVENLHVIVNGMDNRIYKVFGLHGQISFFYIRDLRIEGFRCLDIGKLQFAIHVCTFEDVLINDVIIKGDKDGVHFGRGKRFTVRNGVFATYDDAVAINAFDYDVGNPELGWIEDGVIENCHDLPDGKKPVGYFCRIVAGAWKAWEPGMKVQKSDTVVSNGRLYRVSAQPDGRIYTTVTRPVHESGEAVQDGITWVVVQDDETSSAGVRNVIFRDIFLRKPRVAFSVHFGSDNYCRSYYPGAEVPVQQQLAFDNIRVLHDETIDFLAVNTPVDVLTVSNSSLRDNRIEFYSKGDLPDYGKTCVNMTGCVFNKSGPMEVLLNRAAIKDIRLHTSGSLEVKDDFSAYVTADVGRVDVCSDLTGLARE